MPMVMLIMHQLQIRIYEILQADPCFLWVLRLAHTP